MSISNDEIIKLLKLTFPDGKISVEGDGYKYQTTIVCETFDGLNTLKRQQAVYAALNDVITSGELHALTIKAYTPSEID